MRIAQGVSSVVEFGPGYSTFAFIEAGVPEIVGLEHDDQWFDLQTQRFEGYDHVTIGRYWNTGPVATVPDDVSAKRFDIAFVDSPKGYKAHRLVHEGQADCSRLNTCLAALELAPIVYLHDSQRPLERCTLSRLNALGHATEQLRATKAEWHDRSYGLARIIKDGKVKDRPHLSGAERARGTA
jgi:hypothetical protein